MHTKDRYDKLPDVPTTVELGYDYYNDTVFSVFGPAGMNPAVVKKLEDAFAKAQETPAWTQWLGNHRPDHGQNEERRIHPIPGRGLEQGRSEYRKASGLITEPATQPR